MIEKGGISISPWRRLVVVMIALHLSSTLAFVRLSGLLFLITACMCVSVGWPRPSTKRSIISKSTVTGAYGNLMDETLSLPMGLSPTLGSSAVKVAQTPP